MKTVLVISALGTEPNTAVRVAGLPLLQRLVSASKKAGIREVVVLCERPVPREVAECGAVFASSAQEVGDRPGSLYILLENGYLPDMEFLESIQETSPNDVPFTVAGSPEVLGLPGDTAVELLRVVWVERSFSEIRHAVERENPSPRTVSGTIYDVRDRRKLEKAERNLFRSLIKDTEGFMSRHFERRISLALSRRLVNTSITPNQMTLISLTVGLLGALLMVPDVLAVQVAGALLFLGHSILDGCDGEIARIKFQESRFGGLLDFWGDNVVHCAVFFCIGLSWSDRITSQVPLVLSASAVLGTIGSAGLVYWRTMRRKSGDGPLFTSVQTTAAPGRLGRVADALTRRDFIYLVVILALWGKLEWFLILSALGSPAFFLILSWLTLKDKDGA